MTYPFPAYSHQPAPPRSNGWAVVTLVLGIATVLVCWIPLVGLLGFFTALSGLGTGVTALVVSRARQRGAVMASVGLALCVLGMVLAVVITIVVGRAVLSDDPDDVPRSSGGIGDEVASGDLRFTLLEVGACVDSPGTSTATTCPLRFEVRNVGSTTARIDDDNVAGVVDERYQGVNLYDSAARSSTFRVPADGEPVVVATSISVDDESDVVTDVVFGATDARTDGVSVSVG